MKLGARFGARAFRFLSPVVREKLTQKLFPRECQETPSRFSGISKRACGKLKLSLMPKGAYALTISYAHRPGGGVLPSCH